MVLTILLIYSGVILQTSGGEKLVSQPDFTLKDSKLCPNIIGKVYLKSKVSGGDDVKYQNVTAVTDVSGCVDACCGVEECHVAVMQDQRCFMISCHQESSCLPVDDADSHHNSSLVLVRSPSAGGVWSPDNNDIRAASAARVCEVGLGEEQCHQDEVCRAKNDKSRNGVCECPDHHLRLSSGSCVQTNVSVPDSAPVKLHVFVESQTISLPQSSASLTAITTEQSTSSNPIKYVWKTLSVPSKGEDAIETNKNTKTLTLTHLVTEGLYQFKVIVTTANPAGYGECLANVTVLPAARNNKPPRAVLVPKNQTVTLPTSKAVIDGSTSTDDTPLDNYYWELVSGPVGYQADLVQQSILTLSNLVVGNYTLKLTVTDQDGESDSDTATVEVVKDADYKPKAVAGEDIVIFLPNNSVTLNGSQSYDDHGIVSWEWTKVKTEEGGDLPADISGTQTPLMTVSNMLKGQYNFVLRVTDEAGQVDEDSVTVYVKPPSNLPPVAVAGDDYEVSLPLHHLTLNALKSSDDGNITVYKWSLQSGPDSTTPPLILTPDHPVTNVTGLGVGTYVFHLLVEDNSGNTGSDQISVTIKQDTNQAPVSDPGPNVHISLPVSQVVLDGRHSSDDLGIEHWRWSRDAESLAAGTIVGNTTSPLLIITDLVPGSYSFNLEVSDAQGLSSNKSVKISVSQDQDMINIIELVLNMNLSHFTQVQKNDVLGRVRLLSKGSGELSVEDVRISSSSRQDLVTLHFKVSSTVGSVKKTLSGVDVVSHLKKELAADAELLGVPVLSVQTLICQNNCSGHGYCDQVTRQCVCQPAWMENIFLTKFSGAGAESNCDWSVVYVGLVTASLIFLILSCCCYGTCRRKVVKIRSKRQRYSRLNTTDNIEMTDETRGSLYNSGSDTESEEEILFESSKKGRRLNGIKPSNGHLRNGKMNA